MDDMLVIELPNQQKDEQASLVNSEVNDKLVQTSEYVTEAEENFQDIMATLRRKKGMYDLQRKIDVEGKLGEKNPSLQSL